MGSGEEGNEEETTQIDDRNMRKLRRENKIEMNMEKMATTIKSDDWHEESRERREEGGLKR